MVSFKPLLRYLISYFIYKQELFTDDDSETYWISELIRVQTGYLQFWSGL